MKPFLRYCYLKAREEQNELIAESGIKSSLSEEDIINIVKEAERDVKEKK